MLENFQMRNVQMYLLIPQTFTRFIDTYPVYNSCWMDILKKKESVNEYLIYFNTW